MPLPLFLEYLSSPKPRWVLSQPPKPLPQPTHVPRQIKVQWWERLGHVFMFHPNQDPNEIFKGQYEGWVRVSDQRAREVLGPNRLW